MRTTAIFIFLAIFMSNYALAGKGEKRQKLDVDALIVQLKLDESKVEQFKKILEDQKKSMKATRKENRKNKQKMTREQRKEFRQQQADAMDEKLLTVLTYEQLYNFKKHMRQFRQNQNMNKDRQKNNQKSKKEEPGY